MTEQYIEVYGLHGTSEENAKLIDAGGFDLSKDGYYGAGVYFYENNEKGLAYAINWARNIKKFAKIGIVKADIYCNVVFYIDVTDPNYALKERIDSFKTSGQDRIKTIKNLLKTFIKRVEQINQKKFLLFKVYVPEGMHKGWDCGYVVKSTKIIANQSIRT
ncbi:MAG: hypothetical protein J5934_06350 [Succinivibrio sp.]|nr:hypothetical protein [Succinivibrio sp.]